MNDSIPHPRFDTDKDDENDAKDDSSDELGNGNNDENVTHIDI